jgi:hypothetical protein
VQLNSYLSRFKNANFQIAGWPPYASHLICLLLGAATTNLFTSLPTGDPKVPPRRLLFSLARDDRRLPSSVQIGSYLWPIKSERESAGHPDCLLTTAPVVVLALNQKILLSFDFKHVAELPSVLREEKNGHLRLFDERSVAPLSACKKQRMVRYGSRT